MSSSETEKEKNTGGRSSSTPEPLEGAVGGQSVRHRCRKSQKQLQIDWLRGLSEITLAIDRIEEGNRASK